MKVLILACIIAIALADYGYYNVESDCYSVSCPRSTSEQGTTMCCPLDGSNNAYYVRDASYNIQLTIQTYNMWPMSDSQVVLYFNSYSNWQSIYNTIVIPTYGSDGYSYYMLPCSVQFTSSQQSQFGSYCYVSGTWDSNRVFVTKGYIDSYGNFNINTYCNFVLSDV